MGLNYNNKKQGKKRYSKIPGQYEKRRSYLKIRIVIEKRSFQLLSAAFWHMDQL